ncbi:hypothetical protein QL285_064279 [Trifolium repens]|nr:hypothetical protein QL285_064279 [Trifolium repens]
MPLRYSGSAVLRSPAYSSNCVRYSSTEPDWRTKFPPPIPYGHHSSLNLFLLCNPLQIEIALHTTSPTKHILYANNSIWQFVECTN